MYLRCTQVAFGPGPSDVIIRVDTEDGWEEIIVHRDILKNERVDVGFPIAKRNGSILIELPRESVSGRNRVWVSTESVSLRRRRGLAWNQGSGMILTDREIKTELQKKSIEIVPLPDLEIAVSSTSIDLTLSDVFKKWIDTPGMSICPGSKGYSYSKLVTLQEEHRGHFKLEPRSFVLGWTRETVTIPFKSRLAARVEGKSSLARLGISIHVTAPIIHSGFMGQIQLEMFNFGPYEVELTPGMYVCQLVFEQTTGTPERGYSGVFSGQTQ